MGLAECIEVDPASSLDKSIQFYKAIGRPDLGRLITFQRPWVDYTMEIYLQESGLRGGGGLGILKGDTAREAAILGLPYAILSLLYPKRFRQEISRDFYQVDTPLNLVSPQGLDYKWLLNTSIKANGDEVGLDVYNVPGLPVILLYEKGLEYQYPGENHIDHRLYQDAVLGFGGFKARQALGITPSVVQINEAPTALVLLAEMDYLCQSGLSKDEAISIVKSKSISTLHTLVNAAEARFSASQLGRYVIENLESEETIVWLRGLIDSQGGSLSLSTLAVELSGVQNGVSCINAEFASKICKGLDGAPVSFQPVTNGISKEWILPALLNSYESQGLFNNFLPAEGYESKIEALDTTQLRSLRYQPRRELRTYLLDRRDQYDNPITVDDEAITGCWAKRIAEYKRPGMIFSRPRQLAEILEAKNIHLLMAGKVHPADIPMKLALQSILRAIDANSVLRQRVHFIKDYDAELAMKLVGGVDIGFNTPRTYDDSGNRINSEADGTYWKKLLANLVILISTRDGGVADVDPLPCLEVVGRSFEEEVDSLYSNLEKARDEVCDPVRWGRRVKDQLKAYFAIISMPRMIRDYLFLTDYLPKIQEKILVGI